MKLVYNYDFLHVVVICGQKKEVALQKLNIQRRTLWSCVFLNEGNT